MENRAHALAAGIFVVVVSLFLLALAAWLTRERGPRDTYEISTREIVTGLQPQAPVRLRGVDVGKVGHIGFDAKKPGNVLLTLDVDSDIQLTQDTFATLSYQGVTGLAFIQLSDHGKAAPRLVPNDANPPQIPLQPGLLAKLEAKGEVILEQVEQVAGRLNRLLGDENQKRVTSALASLDEAAGSASKLAQRLDVTMAKRVDPALDQATLAFKSVGRTSDELGQTAADFGRLTRRLNERDGPVDQLAQGTQALAHAADSFNTSTLPRLNQVTEDAGRAMRRIGRAASNIQENPQELIWGSGTPNPGPGEPGFQAPGAGR